LATVGHSLAWPERSAVGKTGRSRRAPGTATPNSYATFDTGRMLPSLGPYPNRPSGYIRENWVQTPFFLTDGPVTNRLNHPVERCLPPILLIKLRSMISASADEHGPAASGRMRCSKSLFSGALRSSPV